ncbi:hypothetical protein MMC26_006077 [Xylographa opegraphella]|nr:hypothetical protein [Xylographa opegraphella]
MSSPPSYITREDLSAFLLKPVTARPSIAVIDVRDDDHVGGHIFSSTHVPSSTLDHKIPELVRTLSGKDIVIFHCALSQQRGPTAARRYALERARLFSSTNQIDSAAHTATRAGEVEKTGDGSKGEGTKQKIYILDGGFVKWQEKYGPDSRLTEEYARDIWVDYC